MDQDGKRLAVRLPLTTAAVAEALAHRQTANDATTYHSSDVLRLARPPARADAHALGLARHRTSSRSSQSLPSAASQWPPREFVLARAAAAKTWPYLGVALYAMTPVRADGIGTVSCDAHWRIYVDPAFFASVKTPQAAARIVHEVMHLLRSHHERCGCRDARAWNIAADAEINDDRTLDLMLPEWAVRPRSLGEPEGLTAEEYYQRASAKSVGQDPQDGAGDGEGGETGEGGGTANKPKDCGSCCGGGPREYEAPADDGTALPSHSAEAVRHSTARAVIEHESRRRGSVPASLLRWAESVIVIPPAREEQRWRAALLHALRAALSTMPGSPQVHSWARQSRHAPPGIILPSRRSPVPSIAIVADTSGSITGVDLASIIASIESIIRVCGRHPQRVIACDAEVHSVTKADGTKRLRNRMIGGGGTDMRVGIQAAEALRPRPQAIVVLTDGYTPWPPKKPRTPVIVGLLGRGGTVPDWAACVRID